MKNLTVVMYHYVRDLKYTRYPRIKGLSTDLFKEQVGYFKRKYNFVSVEQVIDAHYNKTALPKHSILLTFDDAYADHFTTVFPILKHNGIQGAFYPPVKAITEHTVLDVNKIHFILASVSDENIQKLLNEIKLQIENYQEQWGLKSYDYYFEKLAERGRFDTKEVIFIKRLLQVELDEALRKNITDHLFQQIVNVDECMFSRELYMSMEQIQCMVDCGMHIGSHGYDHYWLGSLPKEKQQYEINKSIEFINAVGGDTDNWSICYPYGNYNVDTISLLKESGCKLGLTTAVGKVELNSIDNDMIYKLPRLDTNDLPKDSNAESDKWYQE